MEEKNKKTIDGRILNTWSEEYRLYCEAKNIIENKTTNEIKEYLDRIKIKRGMKGYEYIRNEINKLYYLLKKR